MLHNSNINAEDLVQTYKGTLIVNVSPESFGQWIRGMCSCGVFDHSVSCSPSSLSSTGFLEFHLIFGCVYGIYSSQLLDEASVMMIMLGSSLWVQQNTIRNYLILPFIFGSIPCLSAIQILNLSLTDRFRHVVPLVACLSSWTSHWLATPKSYALSTPSSTSCRQDRV